MMLKMAEYCYHLHQFMFKLYVVRTVMVKEKGIDWNKVSIYRELKATQWSSGLSVFHKTTLQTTAMLKILYPGLIAFQLSVDSEESRQRFQVELEFVQCLANPHYLNFLAQRGYFKDSSFVNYLKYLLYWKKPEYAKFLKYPQCLFFLDLLQYEHFRRELVNVPCAKFIDEQQLLHWQYYSSRRRKVAMPNTTGQQQTT